MQLLGEVLHNVEISFVTSLIKTYFHHPFWEFKSQHGECFFIRYEYVWNEVLNLQWATIFFQVIFFHQLVEFCFQFVYLKIPNTMLVVYFENNPKYLFGIASWLFQMKSLRLN